MSNGAVLSPQSNHADNNNDAKKVKTLGVIPTPCVLMTKPPQIPFHYFFVWWISFLFFYGMQQTSLSGRLDWRVFISRIYLFLFVSLLQVKLEPRSPAKPSRVVHIRNIPNDVTEAEIVHLGIPFGRVTNVLVLKGKNQVLLLISYSMELPLTFLLFC